MTEKRFTKVKHIFELNDEGIKDNQTKIEYYYALDLIDLLNEQDVRIKELESENKMLKTTISRNEAYIKRVTTKGKWSNTGDIDE